MSEIKNECPACGESCHFEAGGRNGEIQCRYCGNPPEDKETILFCALQHIASGNERNPEYYAGNILSKILKI